MVNKFYLRLISIILLAGLFLVQPIAVLATSVDRMAICNLAGHPGETINTSINLTGTENDTRTGLWDIYYKQTDGDNKQMDITSWITITPKEFTIAQGESKVFNVSVKIPDNAAPGLWGATSVNAGEAGHSEERRTYIIFKDTLEGGNVYSGLLIPVSVQVAASANPFAGIINFLKTNIIIVVLVVVIIILAVVLLVRFRGRD